MLSRSTSLLSALDTPRGDRIDGVARFSGWVIPTDATAEWSVELSVDGTPTATTMRVLRPDVGLAYPDQVRATQSGYFGDIVISAAAETKVTVEGTVVFGSGRREPLFTRSVFVNRSPIPQFPRRRNFDVDTLLDDSRHRDPSVGADARIPRRSVIAGVPHFHLGNGLPLIRLLESGATSIYGDLAHQVIRESDGPVLDFGAGIKSLEQLHPNVLLLDAVHFPYVDVVNTCPRLPFRDGAFAAVVSQAVFEHLPDPWQMVKELGRIVRAGGKLLIDTAFLQPYHGSPDHYYNMTVSGLRRMMTGFEILALGVQPYQTPASAFSMQFGHALEVLAEGKWRDLIHAWRQEVVGDAAGLDRALGPAGIEMLAAGVYVLARKPD